MHLEVIVPAEFVAFMQHVVEVLDSDHEDDRSLVDVEDGLRCDSGFGARDVDGLTFVFFPDGRAERWFVTLADADVRAIASGERGRMTVESEPWVERLRRVEAAPPPMPEASRGVALVDDLLARGLVALAPCVRREVVSRFVERVVAEALEHPSLSEQERAAAVVEALLELAGVDDVFGEDAEILAVARQHLVE